MDSTEEKTKLSFNPNLYPEYTVRRRVMALVSRSSGECARKNGHLHDNSPHAHRHVFGCEVSISKLRLVVASSSSTHEPIICTSNAGNLHI